ncbi:ParB/RepB/Spo0J family partition protein (plasmid) [Sphaerotilaceae bacterium SBD11-9]
MAHGLQLCPGQSRWGGEMNKVVAVPKKSAFAGLGDILSGGFAEELASSDTMTKLLLDDIEIREQVRGQDTMEDDENSLDELGDALAKRQAQNIVVRPNPAWVEGGTAKRYILVAGERRVRAARRKGITHLWALVAELTDEEAEELQFAENVQRKNLTQYEEAKRIQRDLDQLGSVDAVLAKHNKSRGWLSKILSLLNLPEQTRRLVKENISADLEIINAVKIIEKADPQQAAALVNDLGKTRGKANAREKVAAVKETVKPKKKPATGSVATPPDKSHEAPSVGSTRKPGKDMGPSELLAKAYMDVYEFKTPPRTLLDVMTKEQVQVMDDWLRSFYDGGTKAKNVGADVMRGFREGHFATDADGALQLVAFLQGADSEAKFSLLNILGAVKE